MRKTGKGRAIETNPEEGRVSELGLLREDRVLKVGHGEEIFFEIHVPIEFDICKIDDSVAGRKCEFLC
jgi:hypothetical protein